MAKVLWELVEKAWAGSAFHLAAVGRKEEYLKDICVRQNRREHMLVVMSRYSQRKWDPVLANTTSNLSVVKQEKKPQSS